jgi:two-component system sensor histidine kinase AgrC
MSNPNNFLLYTSLFIIFIIFLSIKIGTYLQYKRSEELIRANLLAYLKELEKVNTDLSNFRHDYLNILLSMKESILERNLDEIEKIFFNTILPTSEIVRNKKSLLDRLQNISITEIKNLLLSKQIAAQQIGVCLNISVLGHVDYVDIPVIDLIRVVSIILDNAIRATSEVENYDSIDLLIMNIDGEILVSCKNCIRGLKFDRKKMFEKNYSTKDLHYKTAGLGLYSLKSILEKNPSIILTTEFSDEFINQTIKFKN